MTPIDLILQKEQETSQAVTALVALPVTDITSAGEYEDAVNFLSRLKAQDKAVHALWDEDIELANKLHKSLTGKRKRFLDEIDLKYRLVDRKCGEYRQRLEAVRQEEERKLREEAQRIQQEQLLAEAATLEKTGDTLGAECVLAEAINAPAPVVVAPSQVPQVQGAYTRKLPWQFVIADASKLKDEYWCPDVDAIAAIVRSKGKLAESILGLGSVRITQDTKTIIKR
jgi:macrodomain Ter protein organizer (MatP/YcbG family)